MELLNDLNTWFDDHISEIDSIMMLMYLSWQFYVQVQLTISWHAGIQSHCKPISDLWENCSKPIASTGGAVLAMNARIWRKHSNFSYLQVVRCEYLGTSENGELILFLMKMKNILFYDNKSVLKYGNWNGMQLHNFTILSTWQSNMQAL